MVLEALAAGPGTTIVDLPARAGWMLDGTAATALAGDIDHVVIVTSAQVRPVAALAELLPLLDAAAIPYSIVVRFRGWSGVSAAEVRQLTGRDVVAEFPDLSRFHRAVEGRGLPERLPAAARNVATDILSQIGVGQ